VAIDIELADGDAFAAEGLRDLQATPATLGSAEYNQLPGRWRASRGGRGMSLCTRDHAIYAIAQQVHLPSSMLLLIEYSMITDCRLHRG
jgi:hypothetical protein